VVRVYEIAEASLNAAPSSPAVVRIRILDFDWKARKAATGGEIGPLGKGWLL